MTSTRPAERDHASPDGTRDDAPPRSPWLRRAGGRFGAVGMVAGTAGVVLLVIGLVTLARSGIPAQDLTQPTVQVGPFGRSPLMGIIEIMGGLSFLAAAADRNTSGLSLLGLLALVFGVVWLIEPGAFQPALGIGRSTAWLYVAVGVASGVASLAAPPGRVVRAP